MKTNRTVAFSLVFALMSICAMAGDDPIQKMKTKLVGGTWKFSNHWNPYHNNGQPFWNSTDPVLLHTAYTFYDDGTVMVWSLDDNANPLTSIKLTWGIIIAKDSKGKEVYIIKMVDASIDPKNQQAIAAFATGNSFYVIKASTSSLMWIPVHNYQNFNSRDTQNVYVKDTGTPN